MIHRAGGGEGHSRDMTIRAVAKGSVTATVREVTTAGRPNRGKLATVSFCRGIFHFNQAQKRDASCLRILSVLEPFPLASSRYR